MKVLWLHIEMGQM